MKILAQLSNENHSFIRSETNKHIENLITPLYHSPGPKEYVKLTELLGEDTRKICLNILKELMEEMDNEFRYLPGRTESYYVKQKRERTLITLFGDLTYKRTEYIDKSTGNPFCYVDWKLGIDKRERYDKCIQTLIIETYTDQNSMIKVGKIIGDRISGTFNTNPNRDTAISRQTIYNILHRYKIIKASITPQKETPETLYVMADEKYIHLQREKKEGAKKNSQMVKAAVIFEGKEACKRKDGSDTQRYKLINKTLVSDCENPFWEKVADVLHQKYNTDKIKTIYLMGDGASWIHSGVHELRDHETKVKFVIDSFHYQRAINGITQNKDYRKYLRDYCCRNMKDDFIKLVDIIKENSPEKAEKIDTNLTYILKYWGSHKMMINEVKIGCAMEQSISHVLSSSFTSVPKAYSKKNIPLYLNNRIIHQNGYDLRNIIVKTMSLSFSGKTSNISIPDQKFDFSIFEKKTYDIPEIKSINKNVITKF